VVLLAEAGRGCGLRPACTGDFSLSVDTETIPHYRLNWTTLDKKVLIFKRIFTFNNRFANAETLMFDNCNSA